MSKLFDDEGSDEEYQAQPAQAEPVVETQQPAQPAYESSAFQQEQPAQQEEEYNPGQYEQQQQQEEYNPYTGSEQPVQTHGATTTKAEHNEADQRLNDMAGKAQSQLMDQINQFNKVSEASGVAGQESFEAADASTHAFAVTNPQKVGSVVKYTVTGLDQERGRWEIIRRYNEFHILHVTLNERWPGCFIPCIPEKQILGDKEDGFIEERRSLLNRFILECSKFEFIINSEEFKIFAFQAGEVGDTLERLPKQRPTQILDRYRLWFKIEENLDNSELARFREKINVFNQFLVKAVLSMQKDRLMLNNAAQQYQKSFDHYASVYRQFMQYEECAVEFFSDNDQKKKILTSELAGNFDEKLKDTTSAYKSPFAEAALWIKGEMLDIQGMIDAVKGREGVMKKQLAAEQKRREDQTELENLSLGKTTLKSFFKSKSGKEQDILNLQARIEAANVDIEEYRRLINFITIYHGQMAIDRFKRHKMTQYKKMLQNMATRSINNSYLAATLNSGILQVFEQCKV